MTTCRLILFDLDDTLSYFEDFWEPACKEAFAKFPLTAPLDPDRLFAAYRKWDRIMDDKYIRQEITVNEYRTRRFIEALHEVGCEADEMAADSFHEIYFSLCGNHMKPRPEILDLLTRLSQKYALGLVTNGTVDVQMRKIDRCGIRPFFPDEAIFISEKVGCAKPDPRIYQAALERFKILADETVFVGDSWPNDVRGPYEVGIRPVWLRRPDRQAPLDLPVAVLDNVCDLETVL